MSDSTHTDFRSYYEPDDAERDINSKYYAYDNKKWQSQTRQKGVHLGRNFFGEQFVPKYRILINLSI
jgi:hypothetical protein